SAAALQLAKRLKRYAGRQDVCVVALEGNGERVGADLSRALGVRCGVLRGGRVIALPADMHWKVAILVDDAIGDEVPLTRGITELRGADIADRIIAAAPVGASDVCARLRCLADECVVALSSFPFKG